MKRTKLDDVINPLPDTASGQSVIFETNQKLKQDLKDLFIETVIDATTVIDGNTGESFSNIDMTTFRLIKQGIERL